MTSLSSDTRIAGEMTVADWKAIKPQLEGCNSAAIWRTAFKIFFTARLDTRYLSPIREIEKLSQHTGEGFAIIALHCTLIEFLETTIQGTMFRANGAKADSHEYGLRESRSIFISFLTNRVPFKSMFTDENRAKDFYSNVRCGLLHEAQTRGGWTIRVCRSAQTAIDATEKVVYRNKMRGAFDQFLTWYESELYRDAELQSAFIRKFDGLCRD